MPIQLARRVMTLERKSYSEGDRMMLAVRTVDMIGETAADIDRQFDSFGIPADCALCLTGATVLPVGPIQLSKLAGDDERAWLAAVEGEHALILNDGGDRVRLTMHSAATEQQIIRALPVDQPISAELVAVN